MGVVDMKSAKPDGYRLALTPISIFRQPYIQKTNYHPIDDVTYIATYMTYDFIVAVNASSPYKSLADLVNQAKSKPGSVSSGTPGKEAAHHITMAMLSKMSCADFNHIPFKGDTESINALMAGHIDSIVASNTIVPYLSSGKLRALATAANEKAGDFKTIPTLHDAGYGFDMPSPVGISGPKNLPSDIVNKLDTAIRNAQQDPEFQKVLANYSVRNHYFGPKEYTEFAIASFRNEENLLKMLKLD
jgi:tripartite-type tricarboxylate transporter receptor subunit TctC